MDQKTDNKKSSWKTGISSWFALFNTITKRSSSKSSKSTKLGSVTESSETDYHSVELERNNTSDSTQPAIVLSPEPIEWQHDVSNSRYSSADNDLSRRSSNMFGEYTPLSRASLRQSMFDIGYGRAETYTKLNKLGEGSYATIFKGKSRLTNHMVALKQIRAGSDEGTPCTGIREVALLRLLRHANIVILHDIVHTEECLTIVIEYMEMDLKKYLDKNPDINMENVKLFLFQLLRGLAYCHKRQVLHRDLKPQNLLVNGKGILKLADFGLARLRAVSTKNYSTEVVTLWYRPPDVLMGSTKYSALIDVWAVGCIFFEMAVCLPLFPGSTIDEELALITNALGPLNEPTPPYEIIHDVFQTAAPRLDQVGINLLTRFLKYEDNERIPAADSMKHPYFLSLGPEIHALPDSSSIFQVRSIKFHESSQ